MWGKQMLNQRNNQRSEYPHRGRTGNRDMTFTFCHWPKTFQRTESDPQICRVFTVMTVWLACPTRADFHEKMKGRTASNSLPPNYVLQITDNQDRKFCSRIDDVVRLGTGTLLVIWRELEIAYDLMVSGVSFTINKYRKYTPDNCCQIPGVIRQRAPSEFGI